MLVYMRWNGVKATVTDSNRCVTQERLGHPEVKYQDRGFSRMKVDILTVQNTCVFLHDTKSFKQQQQHYVKDFETRTG